MKKIKISMLGLLFASAAFAGEYFEVKEAMQKFVDDKAIPGAVTIVATKDKILDYQAVGYFDLETKEPMPKDAVFVIASQTKTFTSTLFMMLVDEGKISLDDEIEKFIPEFANVMVKQEDESLTKPKTKITMRHLLCHEAGLTTDYSNECKPDNKMVNLEERAKIFAKTPLTHEPNTKHRYSNPSIDVIGRVVEIVSGKTFIEFLNERILEPLDMKETTFHPSIEMQKRIPKAYRANDDKTDFVLVNSKSPFALEDTSREPVPAGGLFSTAEDITKFCQMLAGKGVYKGKRYLSENSINEMAKKQTVDAPWYGVGTQVEGDCFGHGGAFGTKMMVFTKEDLVAVFLIQCIRENLPNGGEQAERVFKKVAEEIYDDYKNNK